jgi:hypothetical protein
MKFIAIKGIYKPTFKKKWAENRTAIENRLSAGRKNIKVGDLGQ